MIAKIIVSLALVCMVRAQDWNYDENGADWDFPNCNNPYPYTQSPAPLSTALPQEYQVDWDSYMFAFLTGFKSVDITAEQNGVVDYVYTVSNFTDGAMGGWYAAEPIAYEPNRELFFQINETRLHFPSEHTLNGVTYDAEFQIFGNELKNSVFWCEDQRAAITVFLTIDDSAEENPFWSSWAGKDTFSYDLTQLFDKTVAMDQSILGYKGSDTMPTCNIVCWYAFVEPFTITQATYDLMLGQGQNITNNVREIQNPTVFPLYNALHISPFGPDPRP